MTVATVMLNRTSKLYFLLPFAAILILSIACTGNDIDDTPDNTTTPDRPVHPDSIVIINPIDSVEIITPDESSPDITPDDDKPKDDNPKDDTQEDDGPEDIAPDAPAPQKESAGMSFNKNNWLYDNKDDGGIAQ